MLIGIGGTILVLVVVFWFIFAFVSDPQVVVDALLSLAIWRHGVLALMAAATYVFLGLTLKNTLSGLGIKDATLGMLASLAVKGSIPGPMDTAFRFRLAIAYDYSVEESSLSAATLKALDWITPWHSSLRSWPSWASSRSPGCSSTPSGADGADARTSRSPASAPRCSGAVSAG